jgi:hypothetical protein
MRAERAIPVARSLPPIRVNTGVERLTVDERHEHAHRKPGTNEKEDDPKHLADHAREAMQAFPTPRYLDFHLTRNRGRQRALVDNLLHRQVHEGT